VVKTRPGVCQKKRRYASRDEAEQVALRAQVTLRAYKCGLCHQFHLTSRTKGLRLPRVGLGIFLLGALLLETGHAQPFPFV
jgi:hypothetical protein